MLVYYMSAITESYCYADSVIPISLETQTLEGLRPDMCVYYRAVQLLRPRRDKKWLR